MRVEKWKYISLEILHGLPATVCQISSINIGMLFKKKAYFSTIFGEI